MDDSDSIALESKPFAPGRPGFRHHAVTCFHLLSRVRQCILTLGFVGQSLQSVKTRQQKILGTCAGVMFVLFVGQMAADVICMVTLSSS